MGYSLAKENSAFVKRMLQLGRFNNQSEVIREALRRMEREETSYLSPPPLTPAQVEQIYGPNPEAEARELRKEVARRVERFQLFSHGARSLGAGFCGHLDWRVGSLPTSPISSFARTLDDWFDPIIASKRKTQTTNISRKPASVIL